MTKREFFNRLIKVRVHAALEQTYKIKIDHPTEKQTALVDNIVESMYDLFCKDISLKELQAKYGSENEDISETVQKD